MAQFFGYYKYGYNKINKFIAVHVTKKSRPRVDTNASDVRLQGQAGAARDGQGAVRTVRSCLQETGCDSGRRTRRYLDVAGLLLFYSGINQAFYFLTL